MKAMGFGLEELKRIWYAILEISRHKNIPTAATMKAKATAATMKAKAITNNNVRKT
jgi:hypothetical protein